MGKLFICPTPIGNLEDITMRTLRVLSEVDIIACEDTRHTLRLLNHFEINKPLTSYHEHNKRDKGQVLLEKLKSGENIALVSDAGMPGISDPGSDMVYLCVENGIEVEVLPGASAFVIALVGSGLETDKFAFEGFLDRDKKKRRSRLEEIKYEKRTLIVYESPYRLKDTLKDMLSIFGNRKISACRELTKKYEEYQRKTIDELILYYSENDPRGEYILIVEGSKESKEDDFSSMSARDQVKFLIDEGHSKKDAIKKVAKKMGVPKNDVYKEVLDL